MYNHFDWFLHFHVACILHELSLCDFYAGVLFNPLSMKQVCVNLIISGVYNNKVRMVICISIVASGLPFYNHNTPSGFVPERILFYNHNTPSGFVPERILLVPAVSLGDFPRTLRESVYLLRLNLFL